MSNQVTIEFSIPKLTLPTTPLRQQFDLGIGARRILGGVVYIPDGHKGLAYLSVNAAGRVILPAQGSNMRYIHGNNENKNFSAGYALDGPPFVITCEGYNLDKFFDHSFTISFDVGE